MAEKIMLGKKCDTENMRSVDITFHEVATLHHSFIGLMKRMWEAIKKRDKVPFRYMGLPDYDLTNFKMEILTGSDDEEKDYGDITIVRFYVKNIFNDKRQKWFAFRDMTLTTFIDSYGDTTKYGLYEFSKMWGWFKKLCEQDPDKYSSIYHEADFMSWYFDRCAEDFLDNNIERLNMKSSDDEVDDE